MIPILNGIKSAVAEYLSQFGKTVFLPSGDIMVKGIRCYHWDGKTLYKLEPHGKTAVEQLELF